MISDMKTTNVARPITGAFIQYNTEMFASKRSAGLTPANWRKEIDSMIEIGMKTIIVQFLEYGDESFMIDPPSARTNPDLDPTHAILEYADRLGNGIKVFIGLWNKDWRPGDLIRWAVPEMLAINEQECIRVAEKAWNRYGGFSSFAGWYIPQEIWNIQWDEYQNARMRRSFRKISDLCKGLIDKRTGQPNNKDVAFSPYFDPGELGQDGNYTPYPGDTATPASIYSLLLKGNAKSLDDIARGSEYVNLNAQAPGAGIDILILQDGVGANEIKTQDIDRVVQPYFREFYAATKDANIKIWGNLESFQWTEDSCTDDGSKPATFSRLDKQISAASIKIAAVPLFSELVTFEFFQYMSPNVHSKDYCLSERKKLFSDYKAHV